MEKQKFTVWITKYALSIGIFTREAVSVGDNMIDATAKGDFGTVYYHGEGRDWHTTRESAVARAEKMRDARAKALERTIKKLRALTFDKDTVR